MKHRKDGNETQKRKFEKHFSLIKDFTKKGKTNKKHKIAKKTKACFFLITLISIFNIRNVNAEIIGNYDTSNYSSVYSLNYEDFEEGLNRFNYENLTLINEYFNTKYSNTNNIYYLTFSFPRNDYSSDYVILYLYDSSASCEISFSSNPIFTFKNAKTFYFYFTTGEFQENSVSTSKISFFSSYLNRFAYPVWTNKDLYWHDIPYNLEGKFIYYKNYSDFSNNFKKYYDYQVLYEYNQPIYTLMDLVGINRTKPSNKTQTLYNYKINYYFDDSLDVGKTENGSGEIGSVISEFTDYTSEFYYLDNTKDYNLTISSNEEENVLNVYYKSYKRVSYKIEYYFDDILKDSYTEIKEDFVDTVIDTYTDYSSDYWTLVENEYSLTISENSDLNVLRIHYHSKNYGTEYQTIDTKNSKIPFIFQFADIKEFFTGVNFDIFTQNEQLQITIFINMWFVAMFTFVSWLFLKIIYKVFQLFR